VEYKQIEVTDGNNDQQQTGEFNPIHNLDILCHTGRVNDGLAAGVRIGKWVFTSQHW